MQAYLTGQPGACAGQGWLVVGAQLPFSGPVSTTGISTATITTAVVTPPSWCPCE
jgi:hypothetical protein